MKAIIIGSKGLAGSGFARIMPGLGYDCIEVTRENYEEMKGSSADILINANGNSSKPLANRDPVGEIERSVASVMRCCNDFNFDRLVLLSSGDVYNSCSDRNLCAEDSTINEEKLSSYGLCKLMAEQTVRNQCSSWLILRLGGILGPGLKKNPVYDLLTGDRIFVHPESSFSFIHADDIARITCSLTEQLNENITLNLCGKGLVKIGQVAEWCEKESVDFDEGLEPFKYDLNNSLIEKWCSLPDTEETVRNFIVQWHRDNSNE